MNLVPWKGKRQDRDADDAFGLAAPVAQMRNEMDRLFERFLGGSPFDWAGSMEAGLPALDVSETDDQVVVRAELPGIDPKELDVSVTGDLLTVSGEKKSQTEQKRENFYLSERRFGSFQRSVRLPSHVDREAVSANYANGVLTIKLKKQESAKAKKVKINVAAP